MILNHHDALIEVPCTLPEDEPYMSQKMRSYFQDVLTHIRNQIVHESEQAIAIIQNSEQCSDEIDSAVNEEELYLELRRRDRERRLLKKVEESLEELQKGDYGYCVICGAEIGLKRLLVRPTATMCIECKSVQEIKEKRGSA